jgi:hypothetical protein
MHDLLGEYRVHEARENLIALRDGDILALRALKAEQEALILD